MAELISAIALAVSLTSLGFSIFFNYRDRAHLKTKSTFYPANQFDSAQIKVSVVNAGRRPIVLRMLGGVDEDGNWVGTSLGQHNAGLRLAEHEVFETTLRSEDLSEMDPDENEIEFIDLWVEDSLGRRHTIREAKANIRNVRENPDG